MHAPLSCRPLISCQLVHKRPAHLKHPHGHLAAIQGGLWLHSMHVSDAQTSIPWGPCRSSDVFMISIQRSIGQCSPVLQPSWAGQGCTDMLTIFSMTDGGYADLSRAVPRGPVSPWRSHKNQLPCPIWSISMDIMNRGIQLPCFGC